MTEMTPSDIEKAMMLSYKQYKGSTKDYWEKRVTSRLKYLKPLIRELMTKEMSISDVSYSLNQEYISLVYIENNFIK